MTRLEQHFPEPIRVMVVDDHARVRQGLRLFLSTCPDMQVVAEAGGGAQALERFAEVLPDVVLIDLSMPGMDSPIVTLQMKELNPASQVIAMAADVDPALERRALAAGAHSCVTKDSSAASLVEAIQVAHGCARRSQPAQESARRAQVAYVRASSGATAC